jgi:uncharacterized iron-regulated protein
MKNFILLVLFSPVFAFAQAKLSDANYRIYSTKTGKEVTLKTIVSDMDNYDVLLMGEEHNDSVTHFIEQAVLELMHLKFGNELALSLEMFDRDVQPVMDEYLQGFIKEKHFRKDARAWSNYNDYRQMVIFAKRKKLDVICANAPTRYTNLAGRKGQDALYALPSESKEHFAPLPYDTASGKYYAKLMGLTHMPAGDTANGKIAMPAMSMGNFNMVLSQSLWDATMAYSITKYLKKNKDKKIMHVNGKFHTDEWFGVTAQLYNYNSRIKPMVISTASDAAFPNINWNNYKDQGDYIIITDPKVPKTFGE